MHALRYGSFSHTALCKRSAGTTLTVNVAKGFPGTYTVNATGSYPYTSPSGTLNHAVLATVTTIK